MPSNCPGSRCRKDQNCSCKNAEPPTTNLTVTCSCEDCTEGNSCLYYTNRLIRIPTSATQYSAKIPSATGDNATCCNKGGSEVTISTFDTLKYTLELCKALLQTPKATLESLKKICFQYSSNKSKSNQEICKNLEQQQRVIEELKKIYLKPKSSVCVCSESSKRGHDDAVNKGNPAGNGVPIALYKNIIKTQRETIKTLTNIYCKGSNRSQSCPVKSCNAPPPAATPEKDKSKSCCMSESERRGVSKKRSEESCNSRGYGYTGSYPEGGTTCCQDKSNLPKNTQSFPKGGNSCCQNMSDPQKQQYGTNKNRFDTSGCIHVSPVQQNVAPVFSEDTRGYVYDLKQARGGTSCCQNNSEPQRQPDDKGAGTNTRGFVYELPKRNQNICFTPNTCCEKPQQQQYGASKNVQEPRGYDCNPPKSINKQSDSKTCCQTTPEQRKDCGGYESDNKEDKTCNENTTDIIGKYQKMFELLTASLLQNKSYGTTNTSDASECCKTETPSANVGVTKGPPKSHKGDCNCKSSSKSFPGSKNAELCKNILEIQKNALETLNSIFLTQGSDLKTCHCIESTKSSESKSHKKSECTCSEKSGHPQKQHRCQHKSSESNKSRGKDCLVKPTDKSTSDETQKKTCYCSESTKIKPKPIENTLEQKQPKVFEIKPQKCPVRPADPTSQCSCEETQVKTCFCSESTKIKQKPRGYILDFSKGSKTGACMQKNTPQTDKCGCEGLNTKCQMLKKDTRATPIDTKNLSDIADKCGCEGLNKKCQMLKKDTRATPIDTKNLSDIEEIRKNENCACKKKSGKLGQTQNTQEMCRSILERQQKEVESLKSVYLMQKSSYDCKELPGQGMKKSDTTKLCTDLIGTPKMTIEALKKIYLQKTGSRKDASNLCNDLKAQKATVEAMKKIYLPPKSGPNIDVCCKTGTPTANLMDPFFLPSQESESTDKFGNLSKYEIFERIKKAYQACSCTVCECIGVKSDNNEQCKCKPCECEECMYYSNKSKSKSNCKCDKRPKKQQSCKCSPCECLECTMKPKKPCDCEPCQCLECQAMSGRAPQSFIVAPVSEIITRVGCSCSPCECIECEPVYPANTSGRHEISTGTNRHTSCRCEMCINEACDQSAVSTCSCQTRNKVMNKPVEKATRDYDIRAVSVIQNTFRNKRRARRHSTLAMFATLSNNFPKFTSNNNKPDSSQTCDCSECECISCIRKEELIFSKTKTTPGTNTNKSSLNSTKSCKCKPCDCRMCKYNTNDEFDKEMKNETSCRCFTCDCLACEGDQHAKNLCKCVSCECTECELRSRKTFRALHQRELCYGDDIPTKTTKYPIKKGVVLTPSTHQTKVKTSLLEKQCWETIRLSASTQKIPLNKEISFKIKDDSKFQTKPKVFKSPSELIKPTKAETIKNSGNNLHPRLAAFNKCEILKCDAYTQCQDRNIEKSSLKNNSIGIESCFSGVSSFGTSPITSYHRDYDSVSPVSRNKDKSWLSSCNSSGHDYAEYLVKFPKSTVEACLTDVMEDMDKILSLDKFDISPDYTNSIGQRTSRTARDNISVTEKFSFSSNEFDLVDNNDLKLMDAKETKPKRRSSSHEKVNHNDLVQWKRNLTDELEKCKLKPPSRINRQASNQKTLNKIEDKKLNIKDGDRLTNSRSLCLLKNPINKGQDKNTNLTLLRKERHSFIVSDINTHNIEDDYIRVQKTLKDAKEFSLELLRLLEMYEKANKEFESVSDKLKKSHESLFSRANSEQKYSTDPEYNLLKKIVVRESCTNEIELQNIHLEAPSKEEVTSTSMLQSKNLVFERTFAESELASKTISQKMGQTKINNNSRTIEENESSGDKLESIYESKVVQQTDQKINQGQLSRDKVKGILKSDSSIRAPKEILAASHSLVRKKKERFNSKRNKKYSKLLKRPIIISKRVCIKSSESTEKRTSNKYCSNVSTSTTNTEDNVNSKDDHNQTTVNIFVKNSEEESLDRKYKEDLSHLMRKLNTVLSRSDEVSVSTATDLDLEFNHVYVCDRKYSTATQDTEELQPRRWSILKKSFDVNSPAPSTKVKRLCIVPPLEQDTKEAVQSISLQRSPTPQPVNKALVNLQEEVKKLLEMPILQSQSIYVPEVTKEDQNYKQENDEDLESTVTPTGALQTELKEVDKFQQEGLSCLKDSMASQIRELLNLNLLHAVLRKNLFDEADIPERPTTDSTCSCESLKVGSVDVRRVSDHSVIVKWNTPRDMSRVQGYELLVDGLAVPTIFGPSKSMAVVTCLPHTDKVLLTIRTITSSVSMIGHYPATTVIYRPRTK